MPFLASPLIYHFPVSVVNNHTETSSVALKPFYVVRTFVLSLVSPAGVLVGREHGSRPRCPEGPEGSSSAAAVPRGMPGLGEHGLIPFLEKRVFSRGDRNPVLSLHLCKVTCSRPVLGKGVGTPGTGHGNTQFCRTC